MYIFLLICCHFIFDQKNVRSRNRNSSLQMKRTGPWYSIMFNIIFSPIIQMSPTHASEFSVVLVCTLHFSNNLICHNIPHQLKASSMMCKHLKSHFSSPINMPLVKMKLSSWETSYNNLVWNIDCRTCMLGLFYGAISFSLCIQIPRSLLSDAFVSCTSWHVTDIRFSLFSYTDRKYLMPVKEIRVRGY